MAQFNENFIIASPNPADRRYLSPRTFVGGSQLPYSSVTEVYNIVIPAVRYSGLTVLIRTGGTNVEYWFKNGVADSNLIEKKYDSTLPLADYVTGGTNLGFFSGYTGVQTVELSAQMTLPNYNDYNGFYHSLYNYYYRGTDGMIHIGVPNDGIQKRGYVKTTLLPTTSWIWNEYIGDAFVGWMPIMGNIANQVGTFQPSVVYYDGIVSFPYIQTSWITGSPPTPNGSEITVNAVLGSLTTGTTLTIGGPPFAFMEHNDLHFRTIMTQTPNTLAVSYTEPFINLSGATFDVDGANIGSGARVYDGRIVSGTDTTLQYRRIQGSGDTIVSEVGNSIVIYSSGGSGGNSTYNLSSPSTCKAGGIDPGTILTGKTAFQLFEEILAPALNPAITPQSSTFTKTNYPGTIFEIGATLSPINFSSTFSRGLISPQYPPTSSAFRSGALVRFNYTGTGWASLTGTTTTPSIAAYGVLPGNQSWTATATYASGVTVYNSKGTISPTVSPNPLPAGTTAPQAVTITGIYPYFWGTSAGAPTAGQVLINGGSKCVASSNGDITIDFNVSAPNKYLWFAIPAASTPKTLWIGSNSLTNTEAIPSTVFGSPTNVPLINSPTSFWSGQTYSFYMTNFATNTCATYQYNMTFKNS